MEGDMTQSKLLEAEEAGAKAGQEQDKRGLLHS